MTARRLIDNQITLTEKRNIRPRKIDELEFASLLLVSHTGGAQELITAGTISPGPLVSSPNNHRNVRLFYQTFDFGQ
ncbi:hypothetical protein MJO28_014905 [Puccinia striiformis f. sp. tritici]|uniref:Uncharacterized protein n=1 Tax=Puccinia striiformis f. sp. tritici TaxID=168172 RepID=A0ACC0DR30_9BASI|nr:hypothetical protein MJO29_014669 [Puccinia striiformis f. sp. tritici]KAI7937985.1 hypothetical protein MJO28_014905 [Puccinia striiformis f. sp. tritici]